MSQIANGPGNYKTLSDYVSNTAQAKPCTELLTFLTHQNTQSQGCYQTGPLEITLCSFLIKDSNKLSQRLLFQGSNPYNSLDTHRLVTAEACL